MCQANLRSVVFGKRANVLNGSMRNSKKRSRQISSTTKCTLEKQKVALMLTHLHPSTYLTNLMREFSQLLISSAMANSEIERVHNHGIVVLRTD